MWQKKLRELGVEENLLNCYQHAYWRTTQYFPPTIRNKMRMSALVVSSQYYNSRQGNWSRKINTRQPDGKIKVKLPLFVDDMILYTDTPKESS